MMFFLTSGPLSWWLLAMLNAIGSAAHSYLRLYSQHLDDYCLLEAGIDLKTLPPP